MTAQRPDIARIVLRTGVAALPLALGAAIWLGLIAPITAETEEARGRLQTERELAQRYAAIAARQPTLAADLVALAQAQAESPRFLTGRTGEVALAALQEHVAAAVRTAGGIMSSVSGSVDSAGEGVERIAATAQFAADIEALSALLYRLETGEPLLFVDRLTIGGQVRPEAGGLVARRMLDVSLGISGYRLVPDPEGRS